MLILKRLIILILTGLILILSNCFDFGQTAEEKKNRKNGERFFLLELITLNYGTKEEGIVVDNKDGTLTYTYRLIQTNGIIGNKTLSEKTILIRRCLIGQVYRTTQNDCQGTGTKDTVWGASQLQWCPTNDRSCEKDGKADSTISPAAKACKEDTYAGKKWGLLSKEDNLYKIFSLASNYLINDLKTPSIPESPIIWLSESVTSNIYPDLALTSTIEPNYYSQKKNLFFSILCKELNSL